MGPGDLAQARHEPGRWHDVAALAEDRLDDDRRNVLGVRQRVQGQVELLLPVAGAASIGSVATPGRAVAIGERRAVHGAGERLEVAAIDAFRGGERHRLGSAAVVAASEDQDDGAPRRHPRQLDGCLHGLGPGVGEEGLPRPTRQHGPEAVVEAQARLVVDDVLLPVQEPRGLLLHGGDDARMGVAGVRDADPGAVVEVSLAVGRDEPAAFAAVHGEVRDAAPDGGDDGPVGERRDGAVRGCRLDHHGLLRVRCWGCGRPGDTCMPGAADQPAGSRRWWIVPSITAPPAIMKMIFPITSPCTAAATSVATGVSPLSPGGRP